MARKITMNIRSKKLTEVISFRRLREVLCPVTTAGARLANLAHNARTRNDVPADLRQALDEAWREWNETIGKVPDRWRI